MLPHRLDDFVAQYKQPKRKEVDFLTYTISDYLLGLQTKRHGDVIADASAAILKFKKQLNVLKSASPLLKSTLVDLRQVVQAELFDSELGGALELSKRGFFRASGAIAGVVLEKHLLHICEAHAVKVPKKQPTLSDLNQTLKDAEVIDTARWRFIQHLTDLRNLCDHQKDREPNRDDVQDLVEGVMKTLKTLN